MADSAISPEQKDAIAPILGRVPSGVFILTASDGAGRETAMLASWVQQTGFDPPLISFAVNNSRYVNYWLKQNPTAAVSIVGKAQSGRFFKQFGKGFEPDEPAFDGFEITRGTTGIPLLTEAVGSLEGRIIGSLPAGDHTLYVLQVENAVTGAALESDEPYAHIRKSGFNY